MPKINSSALKVNDPIEGTAPDATLNVEVDAAKPLMVGPYTFRLQVTDDSGNVSAPFEWKLLVIDEDKPVAVITGPTVVPFGKAFTLSGEKSFDLPGGKLAKFKWTLIQTP
jgi:hypothetical protein